MRLVEDGAELVVGYVGGRDRPRIAADGVCRRREQIPGACRRASAPIALPPRAGAAFRPPARPPPTPADGALRGGRRLLPASLEYGSHVTAPTRAAVAGGAPPTRAGV